VIDSGGGQPNVATISLDRGTSGDHTITLSGGIAKTSGSFLVANEEFAATITKCRGKSRQVVPLRAVAMP
jgi:hypothetical protein